MHSIALIVATQKDKTRQTAGFQRVDKPIDTLADVEKGSYIL